MVYYIDYLGLLIISLSAAMVLFKERDQPFSVLWEREGHGKMRRKDNFWILQF